MERMHHVSKRWLPYYDSGTVYSITLNSFTNAFPADIRKVIDPTNAIESVNMTVRKVTRNHRIFPSDEVVYKVLYLAMQNIAKKWTMPIGDWKPALNRLAMEFVGRFPQ